MYKILDVTVSSRTDKTIRDLKQEVEEIREEAKLIGNQLKVYNPHQQNQNLSMLPKHKKSSEKGILG